MPLTMSMDIERIITLIFLVAFLFFVVYSVFLVYHWHAFGLKRRVNTWATYIYLIGGVILFAIMGSVVLTL